MDGEVLLKRIYKIQDDAQREVKSLKKRYDDIAALQMDGGMSFACQAVRDTSEPAVQTAMRAIDKVRDLGEEATSFSESLQNKLLKVLPASPVALRQMLTKEVKCSPVIPEGNYDLPDSCYAAARRINALNSIVARIDPIAAKIEENIDKQAIKIDYIETVNYDSAKNELTVNGEKLIVGDRSEIYHAILTVLFGKKCHNLVHNHIDDAEIFEAIREINPDRYSAKAAQRKCALDNYKIINNKIRDKVPDKRDLVVRTENGFAINPSLIK